MRPSARVPSRLGAAIEGLAHGGEAPALRRAMTDFGSPWSGLLGRALKTAQRFVRPAVWAGRKLAPLAERTGLAKAWRAGGRGFRAGRRLYQASSTFRFAVDGARQVAMRRGLPQLMSEESARLASLKPYSVVPGHAMSFRAVRGARRMPCGGM